MIRVLIADDQAMVRTGFQLILGSAGDIEVIAQCNDGAAAVADVRRLRPDVALLDIQMPRLDGIEAAAHVAELTKVVIVTTFGHDDYVDAALDAGARGFLLKDSSPTLLVAAVRAAAAGDTLISPQLTSALLDRTRESSRTPTPLPELSERELDVARLVARGLTNAEIGARLFISLGTVKSHLASLQQRLDARNRVEVAAQVWAAGLMQD